jgi:catalase
VTITPEQAVDTIRSIFGRHPGYRVLHAKGTLCAGTFAATPEAKLLTSAAHMSGLPIPVTARFSNGSGDPRSPDYAPDVRGFAVKFYLPDGGRTDIVAQTSSVFPVSTPEAFIELTKALHPSLAMPLRLATFVAKNPGVAARLPAMTTATLPPDSYASIPYYAVHAFRWCDAAGGKRYVRYLWEPELPAKRLSPLAARRRGHDYLQTDILERMPVRFHLKVVVADAGDIIDDPSARWPKSRPTTIVGTLELSGPDISRERDGDVLVFDPTRVTDGIEPSGDPVLLFRGPAYGVSVQQRLP